MSALPSTGRRQHHVFEQRPDNIGGLCALLFILILQPIVELLDARPVKIRRWLMQKGRRFVGCHQEHSELGPSGLQAFHVVDDGFDRSAGFDGSQQLYQLATNFLDLCFSRGDVSAPLLSAGGSSPA
jgi:hypothetical protein